MSSPRKSFGASGSFCGLFGQLTSGPRSVHGIVVIHAAEFISFCVVWPWNILELEIKFLNVEFPAYDFGGSVLVEEREVPMVCAYDEGDIVQEIIQFV